MEVFKSKYSMNDIFMAENRALRLKSERKRLGLIQKQCAKIIECGDASWIRYEKYGEPMNQEQIYTLCDAGFDMAYVVFGIRFDERLKDIKPEHIEVLRLLNNADENIQAKVIQMIRVMCSEV